MAQLARRAGVAREHFAVQHHAAADACAERDDHGALRTFGTADQHLRQRSHVRVVADAQVKARARLDRRAQVKVLPAEVVRVEHAAGLVVHRSWAAEPDAAERGPVHAGRKLCDDCGDAVATASAPSSTRVGRLTSRAISPVSLTSAPLMFVPPRSMPI